MEDLRKRLDALSKGELVEALREVTESLGAEKLICDDAPGQFLRDLLERGIQRGLVSDPTLPSLND